MSATNAEKTPHVMQKNNTPKSQHTSASAATTPKSQRSNAAHTSASASATPQNRSVAADEKFELFAKPKPRSVAPTTWMRALGVYLLIVLLCSLYIFIREKIYIASKEYAELEGKREVLVEENKELERKIEALQFKNKITNYFEVKYE